MEQSIPAAQLQEDSERTAHDKRATSVDFRSRPKGLQAHDLPDDYHLVLNYSHLLRHHVAHELVAGRQCLR